MNDERCTYTIMYVCDQTRDDHTDLHEFGTKPNEVMALRWQLETAGAMGKGLFEKNEELRERCAKLTQRARDAEEALATAREDVLREVEEELGKHRVDIYLQGFPAARDLVRSLSTEGGEK